MADSLALAHHAGFWLGFWIGAPVFLVAGVVLGIVAMLLLAAHDDRDTVRGFDQAMLTAPPASRVIRSPRGTTSAKRERARLVAFVEARKLT